MKEGAQPSQTPLPGTHTHSISTSIGWRERPWHGIRIRWVCFWSWDLREWLADHGGPCAGSSFRETLRTPRAASMTSAPARHVT